MFINKGFSFFLGNILLWRNRSRDGGRNLFRNIGFKDKIYLQKILLFEVVLFRTNLFDTADSICLFAGDFFNAAYIAGFFGDLFGATAVAGLFVQLFVTEN